MGLAAPLDDGDLIGPSVSAGSRPPAANDGFGSLITLGPRKFKKKPVLTLDPEELEKAHLQFQLDGAQIMGEEAPVERAPVPALGLAPFDADEAEDILDDDDAELDDSDLPSLPELLADPDRLLGLAEEEGDEEAGEAGEAGEPETGFTAAPAPSKPRAGIDMVALRLAASLAEQDKMAEVEEPADAAAVSDTQSAESQSAEHTTEPLPAPENHIADEPVREDAQAASPAFDTSPATPASQRKTTIETATESWDLPFTKLTGSPSPSAHEPEVADDEDTAECEQPPFETPVEAEDELLLAEMFECKAQNADWPEAEAEPEPVIAEAAPVRHNPIRAMLVHDGIEPPYDQEPPSSALLSLFARLWRWLTARF